MDEDERVEALRDWLAKIRLLFISVEEAHGLAATRISSYVPPGHQWNEQNDTVYYKARRFCLGDFESIHREDSQERMSPRQSA